MNEQTEQSLDAVFDVAPKDVVDVVTGELVAAADEPVVTEAEILAKEDFHFSRNALKLVAAEAKSTLHRAVEAAEQTDSPRSFEAVAEMVRATLEAHRELHNVHKVAADVRLSNQMAATPPGSVNIQQGVVFSGTSEDLLRLISKDRQ